MLTSSASELQYTTDFVEISSPPVVPKVSGTLLPRERAESSFDAFVDVFPSWAVTRRGVAWERTGAEVIHAENSDRFELRLRAPFHTLVFYEKGGRRDGETTVDGLPPSRLRDVTNKLTFVPADHEYRDSYAGGESVRLVLFYIDEAVLSRANAAREKLGPLMFFDDVSLKGTAAKLKAALDVSGSEPKVYLEALALVLSHELAQFKAQPAAREIVRGGLAAWQQRIVTKYIAEHLAEHIPLATLADMTKLSTFYFCRAFKQSLGVPPHRYHMQLRAERAKELLAERKFSVTEIGFKLGFSDTSSFTTAFRRVTGQTPTGYLRNAL
jgi:AraC family transcriptional regulator